MAEATRRTMALLQIMVLATRITRACHVRASVPATRTTRLVVMTLRGGIVNASQKGVTMRSRRNMAVSAGLVVALVGVRWVLKKSVISISGSMRTLQRLVNY